MIALKDKLAQFDDTKEDGTRPPLIVEARAAIRKALNDLIDNSTLSATPTHSEMAYALLHTVVEINPGKNSRDREIFEQFLEEALCEVAEPKMRLVAEEVQ